MSDNGANNTAQLDTKDSGVIQRNSAPASHKPASAKSDVQRTSPDCKGELEQDFTTKGIEGELQCPFARMPGDRGSSYPSSRRQGSTAQQSGRLPTPPRNRKESFATYDPIEAEFHPGSFTSPPPSVTGSTSKCPIRFLDQHSPEEVAKYFENHKHEIPRSHEICVRRYQRNADSIRELDAKYGNLVSMIQGLGVKHQPLLPADEDEVAVSDEARSADRVEKWAVAVSETHDSQKETQLEEEGQERMGHFDRPLKDIRVGESPSRPWGISVPTAGDPAIDAILSHQAGTSDQHPVDLAVEESHAKSALVQKPSQCPFQKNVNGPSQDKQARSAAPAASTAAAAASYEHPQLTGEHDRQHTNPAQIIFNGPVFIGYPADQAITLLQQFGIDRKPTVM